MPDGCALAVFADHAADLWGVAVIGDEARLALGSLDSPGTLEPLEVEAVRDGGEPRLWTLAAGDTTVRLSAEPGGSVPAGAAPSGGLELGGAEVLRPGGKPILAPALRLTELPGGRLESLRLVGTWVPEGRGVGLLAARPAGSDGQDRDAIEVALAGEDEGVGAFDPRLSCTCEADGRLRHTGLELWLGPDRDSEQRPRRVFGAASGAAAQLRVGELRVQAFALHCHSRGEDGPGVYVHVRTA
jgi:hypothetical protein